ncbi:nucleolar complex protein 4 homolog [Rhinoraja longicauda]
MAAPTMEAGAQTRAQIQTETETETQSGAGSGAEAGPGAPLAARLRLVLGSRSNANAVLDILEALEAEEEANTLEAIRTCGRLFCTLLQRGDLFVGQLPGEDQAMSGDYSAETKYRMWMRHRYRACVQQLLGLMLHESEVVQRMSVCTLMSFVQTQGRSPLVQGAGDDSCVFPVELLKSVVEGLLQTDTDCSTLISCFQRYLRYADVRYYTMASVADNIPRVMQKAKGALVPAYQLNVFTLLSSICMPAGQSAPRAFLVKPKRKCEEYKATKLKEQKKKFEQVWLVFLKYKLPTALYKKVLAIFHEAVLPHMSKPTLMIDFLTAAYDIGGAISLLALNGLFYLIHQHNLEYPDFYTKLYSLLEPSVLHVKYRARFFHLLNIFLSSSHLPAYLVAAFIKRLSRLALTAPPDSLLMVIPLICNLLRRHPSCHILLHRPTDTPACYTCSRYTFTPAPGTRLHLLQVAGPLLCGPLVWGPTVDGALCQGPTVDGALCPGPTVDGALCQGPTVDGALCQGPTAVGGAHC